MKSFPWLVFGVLILGVLVISTCACRARRKPPVQLQEEESEGAPAAAAQPETPQYMRYHNWQADTRNSLQGQNGDALKMRAPTLDSCEQFCSDAGAACGGVAYDGSLCELLTGKAKDDMLGIPGIFTDSKTTVTSVKNSTAGNCFGPVVTSNGRYHWPLDACPQSRGEAYNDYFKNMQPLLMFKPLFAPRTESW